MFFPPMFSQSIYNMLVFEKNCIDIFSRTNYSQKKSVIYTVCKGNAPPREDVPAWLRFRHPHNTSNENVWKYCKNLPVLGYSLPAVAQAIH